MEELVTVDTAGSPRLSRAIAETLAYADLFDYPLTTQEIHRYLVHLRATVPQVEAALADDPWLISVVERHNDLCCLRGRAEIVSLKKTRQQYARPLWRTGRFLARLVAHIPFVRMVAMIGSLAMDNACSANDDIDLFIVTAPGRVWLARAMVIALVKVAALRGWELCPNYLLSTQRLAMPSNDIFTARELAQMIPLYGTVTFQALLAANGWLPDYLPNAVPRDDQTRDLGWLGLNIQRTIESVFGGRLGDRVEKQIHTTKLAQLRQMAATAGSEEVQLDVEVCKGHFGAHGRQTRERYARRLGALHLSTGE